MAGEDFARTGPAHERRAHEPAREESIQARIARLEKQKRKALEKLEIDRAREAQRFQLGSARAPAFAMTGMDPASLRAAMREHVRRWDQRREDIARGFDRRIERLKELAEDIAKDRITQRAETARELTEQEPKGLGHASARVRAFSAHAHEAGHER